MPFSLFVIVLAVSLGCSAARAQPIDPHGLYEQRCAACHEPHASDFAMASLKPSGKLVIGRASGKEIGALLDGHRGTNLTEAEIAALVDHFTAMLSTGWIFREKCTLCHGSAVRLARIWLIVRDGVLIGRYTGRHIEEFLHGHGRLSAEEVGIITKMLRRQLATKPQ